MKKNRGGITAWGCVNIQHLKEISYQKVQIINLNRILMIICRGTNDTHTQIFTSLFRDKLSPQGARITIQKMRLYKFIRVAYSHPLFDQVRRHKRKTNFREPEVGT